MQHAMLLTSKYHTMYPTTKESGKVTEGCPPKVSCTANTEHMHGVLSGWQRLYAETGNEREHKTTITVLARLFLAACKDDSQQSFGACLCARLCCSFDRCILMGAL